MGGLKAASLPSLQILKQEEDIAAKQREGELRRQAEYMATAFAEAALKERSTRLKSLDKVSPPPFPPQTAC